MLSSHIAFDTSQILEMGIKAIRATSTCNISETVHKKVTIMKEFAMTGERGGDGE